MKVLFSILALSFSFAQAQAADYKTTFQMNNPGVKCENEHLSRFEGREVSISDEALQTALSSARTADRTVIKTEIRGLVTVEWSPASCENLGPIAKVLSGTREVYVTKMEDQGKCNAYVLEEIAVSLGKGNPVISGKTTYPILAGGDFSAWSKEICKFTEQDFNKAIQRVVRGQ